LRIPPGLQRVVQRCLEKNPDQRFQSAADLAFALEALSESGVSSPILPPLPRPRSRRWLLGSSIVAFAAIAALLYAVVFRNAGAMPHVSGYVPITHSGDAGQVLGTDGVRLYLSRGDFGIAQVAAVGGDITPVQTDLPNAFLMDVSRDGSKFLIGSSKAALAMEFPIWSEDIMGGSHQYLTAGLEGSWSPDGSRVAYLTRKGTLGVVQSDGTGAHPIRSFGEDLWSVNWSPDGKALRFSKEDGLWEISATGTNLHSLLAGWKGETCCGIWSPDGDTFYFNSQGQLYAGDERHSWMHKNSLPLQLTSAPMKWGQPVPSKDGTRLFVRGATSRGELNRWDPNTEQFLPYLGGISADNVAFSRDGKFFVYVTYPGCVLWRARLDGGDKVQLTNPPLCAWLPQWSPDGSQISFVGFGSGGSPAYIVPSDGDEVQRLLPDDKGPETDPTWSPDGSRILFSNSPQGGKDPNSVLKIMDMKSKEVSIVPGSKGMFGPRWSPDGLAIASVHMDSTDLSIFDFRTQRWSVIRKGTLGYPSWSPDSKMIYYMTFGESPGIFRVHVADGRVEPIVNLKNFNSTGNFSMWMALDPTGAPLLLRDLGTRDIYALTLDRSQRNLN
jgi:Tol biopolymer transport system component